MSQPTTESSQVPVEQLTAPGAEPGDGHDADALVEQDLLVEDVSIDGMCGVY